MTTTNKLLAAAAVRVYHRAPIGLPEATVAAAILKFDQECPAVLYIPHDLEPILHDKLSSRDLWYLQADGSLITEGPRPKSAYIVWVDAKASENFYDGAPESPPSISMLIEEALSEYFYRLQFQGKLFVAGAVLVEKADVSEYAAGSTGSKL